MNYANGKTECVRNHHTLLKGLGMIHYSCDRCKRTIETDELRYIVKVEAYAAMDPIDGEEPDDDRDHLLEIQEILERMDDTDCEDIGDDVYNKVRYDLCPACYRKYSENPLGREASLQFGFSDN